MLVFAVKISAQKNINPEIAGYGVPDRISQLLESWILNAPMAGANSSKYWQELVW